MKSSARKFAVWTAMCALLAALLTPAVANAQHAAMEMFACNYLDGKNQEDLLGVAKEWDQWADKHFSAPYNAYVMTPLFANFDEHPDVIWLGVSDSPATMGKVNDEWLSKGKQQQANFDGVLSCGMHALLGAWRVRAYDKLGQSAYLQVQSCERKPGVSWAQIAKADADFAEWMTAHEIPGGFYRWSVGPGAPKDSTADFYSVWMTESLEQRGQGVEKFNAVATGPQDIYRIYGDDNLYDCDKPRIWYGQPVGGKSS